MTTAKLFQNGHSQAIRLPKAFRFSGEEVKISKLGKGVLIEPIEENGFEALTQALEMFSEDFMESGRAQPLSQDREDLFE